MQSDSIKRQVKAIWAILAMLTIWCMINTTKINVFMPDFSSLNKSVNVLLERVNSLENAAQEVLKDKGLKEYEEIYEEQTKSLESFSDRFCKMRYMYGAGAIFDWNGDLYTTYFAEELVTNNR